MAYHARLSRNLVGDRTGIKIEHVLISEIVIPANGVSIHWTFNSFLHDWCSDNVVREETFYQTQRLIVVGFLILRNVNFHLSFIIS